MYYALPKLQTGGGGIFFFLFFFFLGSIDIGVLPTSIILKVLISCLPYFSLLCEWQQTLSDQWPKKQWKAAGAFGETDLSKMHVKAFKWSIIVEEKQAKW